MMLMSSIVRSRRWLYAGLLSALTALAACERPQEPTAEEVPTEMDWARAALERNPNLEIVAVDSEGEVFTVRDKRGGELLALPLQELAAGPVASWAPPTQTSSTTAPIPPPAPQAAAQPAQPSPAPPPATTELAPPAADPQAQLGYTIERSEGQLKVTGPGVSIVSAGDVTTPAQGADRQRDEPIICEGRRMLQLDNRDMYVAGDAITARSGCELHITNSRIMASGVAVVIQDATVHIANSHIEGAQASFAAADAAKVFARGSTFRGISRRGEKATIQDQGGNRWQ